MPALIIRLLNRLGSLPLSTGGVADPTAAVLCLVVTSQNQERSAGGEGKKIQNLKFKHRRTNTQRDGAMNKALPTRCTLFCGSVYSLGPGKTKRERRERGGVTLGEGDPWNRAPRSYRRGEWLACRGHREGSRKPDNGARTRAST